MFVKRRKTVFRGNKLNKNAIILTALLIGMFYILQSKADYLKFYDGGEYIKVAESLPLPVAEAPFCYRILTPALSLLIPLDHDKSFQIINIFAFLFFGLLLYKYTGSLLSILVFAIPYHSPLRVIFYYPVLVDALFYLSIMIALVMLSKKEINIWLYSLVAFLAVLNREIAIIIPIMLFFRGHTKSIIPITAAVIGIGITRLLGSPTTDYSFMGAIELYSSMTSAGHIMLALFFGLTPLVIFADFKFTNYEKVYLIFIFALCFISGANLVRYLFWTSPVLIPSIIRGLKRHSPEIQTILITVTAILLYIKYDTYEGWHITIFSPHYEQLIPMIVITFIFVVFRGQDIWRNALLGRIESVKK